MILCVPPVDGPEWPTLGPAVWRWITSNLCYGPGDLLGQPIKMDEEWLAILCRLYSVWPEGHEWAGRRVFKRGVISRRKGRAKTELAAWISAAELHPRAPVRCVGWTKAGNPRGGPVGDPYIPLVAYTEEQGETTIYGALKAILERSKVARDFDIGLERIMRVDGTGGRAEALAAEPNARDGARTTFQVFEETHRWTTPRLKRAYQTMMANLPKRRTADAWSLEVTTSYAPGEGSIAEASMEHARAVADGRVKDSRLFFSHRQAPDDADISTPENLRAAVIEASGEVAAGWSDLEAISDQFSDPNMDQSTLRRLWLNQIVRPTDRAFDAERWAALARPRGLPAKGRVITLGFDGARTDDATSLIGTDVVDGYQFRLGLWERPQGADEWEVPLSDVVGALEFAFGQWTVWRMYADPPYWETPVNEWAGRWGEKVVVRWYTNQMRKMAYSIRAFLSAIEDGSLTHDGDQDVARHIANAYRRQLQQRDETGTALWVIQKESKMSPLKIDAAMGSILSWQARLDALADGQGRPAPEGRVHIFGDPGDDLEDVDIFEDERAWT